MKRDQAVEIVIKTMDDFYSGFYVPRRLADRVLENLEKAGMLPPSRDVTSQEIVDAGFPPHHVLAHTWDKESE